MAKQLSDLTAASELISGDLLLLRNISGIDQKISVNEALSKFLKGYNGIVLTEWDTLVQPQILSGSLIEINGSFYINPLNITISGTTANSTWFDILLTPSGTTFTASFIARGTGVWSDSKYGLYSGNNRVVACIYRDGSGNFINKNILIVKNRIIKIKMEIGDWDMDATTTKSITPHGLNQQKVRHISGIIRDDSETTYSPLPALFDVVTGLVEIGIYRVTTVIDIRRLTGGIFDNVSYNQTSFNRGWIFVEYEI